MTKTRIAAASAIAVRGGIESERAPGRPGARFTSLAGYGRAAVTPGAPGSPLVGRRRRLAGGAAGGGGGGAALLRSGACRRG